MAVNVKKIVAAIDVDDDLADSVLSTAAGLSEVFSASLHVVDVITPMKSTGTLFSGCL